MSTIRILTVLAFALVFGIMFSANRADAQDAAPTNTVDTFQYYVGATEGCVTELRVGRLGTTHRSERGEALMVVIPVSDFGRVRTRVLCH